MMMMIDLINVDLVHFINVEFVVCPCFHASVRI